MKSKTNRIVIQPKVLTLIIIGVLLLSGLGGWLLLEHRHEHTEQAVKHTVQNYFTALNKGDLSQLKKITCGSEQAYYNAVNSQEFQDIYAKQKELGEIFQLSQIESVATTPDTATAEIKIYKSNATNKILSTGISLAKQNQQWKVCSKT